ATGEPDMGAPAAVTFLPTYIAEELTRYRGELLAGGQPDPTLGMGLLMASAEGALSTNPRASVENLRAALRISPDDRDLWSRLAVALMTVEGQNYQERGQLASAATSTTYQAYLLTRGRNERAGALAEMGRALDR